MKHWEEEHEGDEDDEDDKKEKIYKKKKELTCCPMFSLSLSLLSFYHPSSSSCPALTQRGTACPLHSHTQVSDEPVKECRCNEAVLSEAAV